MPSSPFGAGSRLRAGTQSAGAAALAAALQERWHLGGKRVAVIQSGGNIDRALLARVLAEECAATA